MNAPLRDHLSESELTSYALRSLDDVARETMDRHLAACPSCRGRLDQHEALQRRIRSDLRSALQTVYPSRRGRPEGAASVVDRIRVAELSRRFGWLLSNAAVLCVVLLQMALLAALLTGAGAQPVHTAATGQPGPTDVGGRSVLIDRQQVLPRGWVAFGSQPEAYQVGVDRTMAHSGLVSGYICSRSSDSLSSGALQQTFAADAYRGQRVRLSGFVQAGIGSGWAGLWMRTDGPQGELLALSDMSDRPILETIGWERHEIVLNVPQESVSITFGVSLEGIGCVWVDDFRFDVVELDVPTSD